MTKVFDFTYGEVALFEFTILFVLVQSHHDTEHMAEVIFDRGGVYQNVIKVYDHEVIEPIIKQGIHSGLESGWGIGESKRHDDKLICTITGSEGGFVFVTKADGYLVVATVQIKLRKPLGTDKAIV